MISVGFRDRAADKVAGVFTRRSREKSRRLSIFPWFRKASQGRRVIGAIEHLRKNNQVCPLPNSLVQQIFRPRQIGPLIEADF